MPEPDESPRPPTFLVAGLALAGSLLLLAGTFCPVLVLPSGAWRCYYDFQPGDGNIVIGLSAGSFVLTWVFRWYRGLYATGGLALFMIGATLLKVPRAGLAGAALTWGWLPLVAGAVLLLAAALAAEKQRPLEPPPAEDDPLD